MKKTAAELATIVGGKLYGNAEQEIVDVRGAMDAGPEHVTFAQGVYAEHLDLVSWWNYSIPKPM